MKKQKLIKLWILVEKKSRKLVSIIEADNRGIPFSVAAFTTKKELVRYLKSYGYFIKGLNVLLGDEEWDIVPIYVTI